MAKNINRKVTIYINGKEVENTLKGMKAEMSRLVNEQRQATFGSKEYIEATTKIETLKKYIEEQTGSVKSLKGEWKDTAETLAKYSNILMGIQSAFEMLDVGIGKLKDLSKDAAALDDVYADVMKTTGLTHEQVENLNKAFLKMDTRTSREQLNQLAYEAGKLGINSEEAVKQFVSASDKINIALGDVLGEGAMVTVGKLTNIYEGVSKTLDGKNLEEKMLAIGSAVNSLGQASTANEGYMVEFMKRLGGIAAQAGLSADQVLGYASALDQNGQAVEMSATAFMKLIQQMVKKPQEFVAAAGVSMEDFKKMMDEDMNGAVMRVLEGMEKGGGFQQLIGMFADMGLDGARAATVVSALAKHLDQVREAQALANQEMMSGSSVINEFNTKNDTMQAKAEKAKKRFEEVRIELGNNLYPILIHLQKSGTVLLKGVSGMIQIIQKYPSVLIPVTSAVIALNKSRAASLLLWLKERPQAIAEWAQRRKNTRATLEQSAAMAVERKARTASLLQRIKERIAIQEAILAKRAELIVTGQSNKVIAAETALQRLRVAEIKAETLATNASTAATKASAAAWNAIPFMAIITALTMVGSAIAKNIKHAQRFSEEERESNKAMSEAAGGANYLFDRLEKCKAGTEEYKAALEKLNEMYPDILHKYDLEKGGLNAIRNARQEIIDKIKEQILEQRKLDKINEIASTFGEEQEEALQQMRKYFLKKYKEKGSAMYEQFVSQLPEDYGKRVTFESISDIYKNVTGEDTGDMFGWNKMKKAIGDYVNAVNEAYDETKEYDKLYAGMGYDNDPFKLKSKNLEELTALQNENNKAIERYQKLVNSGRDGYSANLNSALKKANALSAAISKLKSSESSSETEPVSGGSYNSSSDTDSAVQAAEKWANVKIRVDKMVAESALKTSSGLKKVNDEIVVRFDDMRKEVRDAATEAGVRAGEEIRKLDEAEAALKRAKIDEYIKKMSDEYAKMSSNVKSSEVDENIAKVEQAAKKLQEELSSIDGAIAVLSSDAKNASAKDKEKIDELIVSYRELKSEITNAAFSNILDNAQASPINKRDKSNWSSSTQSKVQSRTNSLGMFFDKSSFEAYGNALEEINKKYEAQKKKLSSLSLAEDAVISELEKRISLESDPEEQNALKQSLADHKARKEAIAGEVEKLEEYKDEAEQIADEDAFGSMLEQWIHGIEEFSKSVLDIFSGINTILDNIGDRELKEQEERKDNGIKALDDELKQGLISQEEYEEEKEAIEEDYEEKEKAIKLEQWKRGKALSISQATIDGALAVLKALASAPPPYNAILAAAAGVAAGVQIAAIASEPAPYAKGGYIDNKKYIVAGEAGREWIASNRLLNDPATAPMISALEQYQRGNRRAMTDIPMAAINMPMAMEASKEIGRRQYNPQTVVLDESRRNVASIASDNNEMVAVMKELASYLKDPNNRRAVISRQSMIDFENKENFLRSRASL